MDSQQFLEAEMRLWRDWQSSDKAVAGPAAAQMAEMLEQAKRFPDAAVCYRQLGQEFADVVCHDSKTGKQLVAALPPSGEILQIMKPEVWPSGRVEVKEQPSSQGMGNWQPPTNPSYMPCVSESGPFFSGMSAGRFDIDGAICGYDRLGHECWKIASYAGNFNSAFAIQGHLLLVQTGFMIVAVDLSKPAVADDPEPVGSRT